MTKAEYERLKEQASRDFQENLAAIERVWLMSQAAAEVNGAASPTPRQTRVLPKQGTGRGKVLKAVRKAVKDLTVAFTFETVIDNLAAASPSLEVKKGSVNAALKRLVSKGELSIVSHGTGRKATLYKVK